MKIPTYEQQLSLVQQGYAKKSSNGRFDTFKYARKVMYKYPWDELEPQGILECRGHTYDNQTGQLVSLPMHKSFNYLELGTWKDVPLSQTVMAYKKYNGYMVAATIYDGGLVVSTTGTTTSNYATYAKDLLQSCNWFDEGSTALFECVADWDKHIVYEQEGLHFLGARDKTSGEWAPFGFAMRCTLEELLYLAKHSQGEGWMVYLVKEDGTIDNNSFCKVKTDYYVGKRKLMRMKNADTIWSSSRTVENSLPDRWKYAVEAIQDCYTQERWSNMTDQERRSFLESIEK